MKQQRNIKHATRIQLENPSVVKMREHSGPLLCFASKRALMAARLTLKQKTGLNSLTGKIFNPPPLKTSLTPDLKKIAFSKPLSYKFLEFAHFSWQKGAPNLTVMLTVFMYDIIVESCSKCLTRLSTPSPCGFICDVLYWFLMKVCPIWPP